MMWQFNMHSGSSLDIVANATPYGHLQVQEHLNWPVRSCGSLRQHLLCMATLVSGPVRSCGALGQHLLYMATLSLDLSLCDFFLWDFINSKDIAWIAKVHQHHYQEHYTGHTREWEYHHAMPHVGCTPNAFKVTMKLQIFLFQTVLISCISVLCSLKNGLTKLTINLCTPCIIWTHIL